MAPLGGTWPPTCVDDGGLEERKKRDRLGSVVQYRPERGLQYGIGLGKKKSDWFIPARI